MATKFAVLNVSAWIIGNFIVDSVQLNLYVAGIRNGEIAHCSDTRSQPSKSGWFRRGWWSAIRAREE
jgi:hypothetical protein